MDSLGKRSLAKVLDAPDAEAALGELSDQALGDLYLHTEAEACGWAARLVHGLATLEAARRFVGDREGPSFP